MLLDGIGTHEVTRRGPADLGRRPEHVNVMGLAIRVGACSAKAFSTARRRDMRAALEARLPELTMLAAVVFALAAGLLYRIG